MHLYANLPVSGMHLHSIINNFLMQQSSNGIKFYLNRREHLVVMSSREKLRVYQLIGGVHTLGSGIFLDCSHVFCIYLP